MDGIKRRAMNVCEFCRHFQTQECRLGLTIPKTMSCREFRPSIEQFCSDPKDFVGSPQIVQMAKYFGFQRTEMKKIKLMAIEEETSRANKLREDSVLSDGSDGKGLGMVGGRETR